eukprot:TRINITY_DN2450_c0_g1_i1.p1 TRINITY_DN2450_c0_g1~~TRINITY_DN2450_c0_g1_i1.p1  ORF type:complete len:202 (+),score=53.01 TRINITY_DN2450_c0_g1_i1:349-954(+)
MSSPIEKARNKRCKALPPTKLLDHLYLGSYRNAHDQILLAQKNIKYVLCCADDVDVEPPPHRPDIIYKKIPLVDEDHKDRCDTRELFCTKNFEMFDEVYAFIEEAKAKGVACIVHCKHGRSRSAFVVIGYLMKALELSFVKAHNYVMERRPIINPHMKEILVEYDVYLKSQRAKKAFSETEAPHPPQEEEEEHLMEANFEV